MFAIKLFIRCKFLSNTWYILLFLSLVSSIIA